MDANEQPVELDQIQIASPCSQNWESMKGDFRVRHCGACKLNVYNVSEMTRDEAQTLIEESEGRLCLRLYRRRDGTVLTSNCPSRFRRVRRGLAMTAALLLGWLGLNALTRVPDTGVLGDIRPPLEMETNSHDGAPKLR